MLFRRGWSVLCWELLRGERRLRGRGILVLVSILLLEIKLQ